MALDALTEYWKGISYRHPTLDGEMAVYADCKGIIKRLPSAQPHWIPCNERLPKSGEQVFTYLFGDSPYIAWYNDRDGKWHTDDFTLNADEEPKEWLPLPMPNRGKRK